MFYPRKLRAAASLIFWLLFFGALPLLIISPAHYADLLASYGRLLTADHSLSNGISLMGFLISTFGDRLNKTTIVLGGMIIFCVPLLRWRLYDAPVFRRYVLSAILLWIVTFNHRAESETLILAAAASGIWFFASRRTFLDIFLLILSMALMSLAPLGVAVWLVVGKNRRFSAIVWFAAALAIGVAAPDIFFNFPLKKVYRDYISPYALRALPATLIWLKITADLLFQKQFEKM